MFLFVLPLFAADLNDDGYDDVVAWRDDEIDIYVGSGSGLTLEQSVTPSPSCGYINLATGDFDGDGQDEVALVCSVDVGTATSLYVSVISWESTTVRGVEYWQFAESTPWYLGYIVQGISWAPYNTDAGDFNGDGTDDLIVPTEDGTILCSGNGRGVGLNKAYCEEDNDRPGLSVYVGDLDNDGKDDYIVEGISSDGVFYPRLSRSWSTFTEITASDIGGAPERLQLEAVGDIDGDGWDDVLLSDDDHEVGGHPRAGRFAILEGSDTGPWWSTASWVSQNTSGVEGSADDYNFFGAGGQIVDVNGDGYDDVVLFVGKDEALQIFYGSSAGLNVTGDYRASVASTDFPTVDERTTGDYNGDGRGDIVVQGEDTTELYALHGTANSGRTKGRLRIPSTNSELGGAGTDSLE